jgi:hypothetical protein
VCSWLLEVDGYLRIVRADNDENHSNVYTAAFEFVDIGLIINVSKKNRERGDD